jgi:uncharacterized repeat protein (TIGR02543 family)
VPALQHFAHGSVALISANSGGLVREGYVFTGWNTSADGSGTHLGEGGAWAGVPAGNHTLYAQWTADYSVSSYWANVSYSANGANSGNAPSVQHFVRGSNATLAGNSGALAKEGYNFAGWNTSAAGSGTSFPSGGVWQYIQAGNVTLYAKWTPKTYVLSFDANGGQPGVAASKNVVFDSPVGVLPAADSGGPSRTGYSLSGWSSVSGRDNANDITSGTVYSAAGNTTAYAIWHSPPLINVYSPSLVLDSEDSDGGGGSSVNGYAGVRITARITHFDLDYDYEFKLRVSGQENAWTVLDSGAGVSAAELSVDEFISASALVPGVVYEAELTAVDTAGDVSDKSVFFMLPMQAPPSVGPAVSGTVSNPTGTAVTVTVTLEKGNISIAPSSTLTLDVGEDGNFSFMGVPDGWYNVVVNDGINHVTEAVHVRGGVAISPLNLEFTPRKQSAVRVLGSAFPIAVGGINALYGSGSSAYRNEFEKAVYDSGGKVEFRVDVRSVATDGAIAEAARTDKLKCGFYTDISLIRSRYDAEGVQLSGENVDEIAPNVLDIAIPLPAGTGEVKAVYRLHNGAVEKIGTSGAERYELPSGEAYVVLHVSKFSVYALAFADGSEVTPDNPPPPPAVTYYTVTFNYGGVKPNTQVKIKKGSLVARPANPVAAGKSFGGWFADSGFKTAYNFGLPVNKNMTIYAKWTSSVVKPNVLKIRTPLKTVNLTRKKTYQIVTVLDGPKGVALKDTLKYKTSNKKVATVSKTGKIKALKAGSATITVTASNGRPLKIKVRVQKKAYSLKKFTLKGVPKKRTMKVGKTAQLSVKLNPSKATNVKVTFKSSRSSRLSVDKAGKITAKKKGKYKVTVKVGKRSVRLTITVK